MQHCGLLLYTASAASAADADARAVAVAHAANRALALHLVRDWLRWLHGLLEAAAAGRKMRVLPPCHGHVRALGGGVLGAGCGCSRRPPRPTARPSISRPPLPRWQVHAIAHTLYGSEAFEEEALLNYFYFTNALKMKSCWAGASRHSDAHPDATLAACMEAAAMAGGRPACVCVEVVVGRLARARRGPAKPQRAPRPVVVPALTPPPPIVRRRCRRRWRG